MNGDPPPNLINPRTGKRWRADVPRWNAPDDGLHLNLELGTGLSPSGIDTSNRSLWRYGSAIRVPGPAATLGEGWTPLIPVDWPGLTVHAKCDHMMPSGSFKDRGTAVMLAHLKALGVDAILEDSSGNGGSSVATYAAASGIRCRILTPASAPAAKKIQMRALGADLAEIAGSRQDVAEAALTEAATIYYSSHNWEPFFIEGTKTLAFELWEQFGFRVPDRVIVPLGYGSNVLGCWMGFSELLAAGEIDRIPAIHGVQAANCAPFLAAERNGGTVPEDFTPGSTLADGIASQRPVRVREVLEALSHSGGGLVEVSEEAIVEALHMLARRGLFVEPTSASAWAGLSLMLDDETIRPDDSVAVVVTGSGLKTVEKIGAALGVDGS